VNAVADNDDTPLAIRTEPEVLAESFIGNLKPTTRVAYEHSLKKFAEWLGVEGAKGVAVALCAMKSGEANLTLLRYTNSLPATLSPSAVNQRMQGIRSMVKLARMVGFITWEIQIPSRRVEPFRDTRGPGEEAVAKMFATLGKSDSPKARRDQAILRLLFDLGLRRESIVSLDLQHWSDESRTLQVMLKGHSQRMPKRLPPVTADAIKRWIQVRGTQQGPLFVRIDRRGTPRPDRLSGDGIHDMITKLGAVSRIERRVRPHGIRHTAITKASRLMKTANLGLPALQAFSNHRSPATLGRYIDPDNEAAYSLAELVSETAPME